MLNRLKIEGKIASDIQKKEVAGRPVCLFDLQVAEAGKSGLFHVLAWDTWAEWMLISPEEDLARGICIDGKLTSRLINYGPELAGMRVEIVALSIHALPCPTAPTGNLAPYPAAELSEARREAELGEGDDGYNREAADAAAAADIAANGPAF